MSDKNPTDKIEEKVEKVEDSLDTSNNDKIEAPNSDVETENVDEDTSINETEVEDKEPVLEDAEETSNDTSLDKEDETEESIDNETSNESALEKQDDEAVLEDAEETYGDVSSDKEDETTVSDLENTENTTSDDVSLKKEETKVEEPVKLGALDNIEEERKRAKKKKKILRKQKAKKIFTGFLIFVLVIYMVIGVVGGKYALSKLEGMATLDINDLLSEESSKIYDTNGNLITEIGTYYRENITYDQCPESLVDAFLSIEDSRFFEHNGFDIPRFTKAAIETLLLHRDGGGGSTFTMQLIKNSYFSIDAGDDSTEREATIEYKVQQIMLSMQLETQLSKKEIFELYMNKLNFGDRIRGVEKASKYYFGKSASEMNLSESALLAGIINMPNQYNPYHYLDQATTRRNEVLYLMRQHGYISDEEYRLAKSINVEDQLVGADKLNESAENSDYAQYVDVVIEEAVAMTGKDPVVYGMDIYTAMEPVIQERIEAIERGETSVVYADDLMQTSIVTMNNTNGEIVGVGGGRNYEGGARLLNRATSQYKQPGSSVKPILSYALGF